MSGKSETFLFTPIKGSGTPINLLSLTVTEATSTIRSAQTNKSFFYFTCNQKDTVDKRNPCLQIYWTHQCTLSPLIVAKPLKRHLSSSEIREASKYLSCGRTQRSLDTMVQVWTGCNQPTASSGTGGCSKPSAGLAGPETHSHWDPNTPAVACGQTESQVIQNSFAIGCNI